MRNFNGGGNMKNMMKQVQKLQKDMEAKREEVANQEFEVSSGGGVCTVTINGNKEITKIVLDPEVVDPDDVETLCDLIMAATNEAIKKADDEMENAMGQFTKGLNMPGLF
nr:YbaB/EbfC family nucleoid-associated protein [Ezakiella coagulans]